MYASVRIQFAAASGEQLESRDMQTRASGACDVRYVPASCGVNIDGLTPFTNG